MEGLRCLERRDEVSRVAMSEEREEAHDRGCTPP
jgi:hypothetical protein